MDNYKGVDLDGIIKNRVQKLLDSPNCELDYHYSSDFSEPHYSLNDNELRLKFTIHIPVWGFTYITLYSKTRFAYKSILVFGFKFSRQFSKKWKALQSLNNEIEQFTNVVNMHGRTGRCELINNMRRICE